MQEHTIIDIISTITRKSPYFLFFKHIHTDDVLETDVGIFFCTSTFRPDPAIAIAGECPISTLPLLQTRTIVDEHIRQLLFLKAPTEPWVVMLLIPSQEMGRVEMGKSWRLVDFYFAMKGNTVCGIILISFCRVSKSCYWPFFLCLPSGMSESNHFPSVWTKFAEGCVFFLCD